VLASATVVQLLHNSIGIRHPLNVALYEKLLDASGTWVTWVTCSLSLEAECLMSDSTDLSHCSMTTTSWAESLTLVYKSM